MREIKFRVWNKTEDKMTEVKSMYFPLGSPSGKDITIHDYDDKDIYVWLALEDVELMEYTGLKDKNGVEIYEGDICKVSSEYWYSNNYFSIDEPWALTMQVANEDYSFKFKAVEDKCMTIFLRETNYNDFEIEVVGNIYEKEELLEVRK